MPRARPSQGDREHLPRSPAHDLIEHRTARLVGLGLVVDYLEHGRTFPTGAPTRHMIRLAMGYRSSSGRCPPSHPPAEDHPQVLIIAPVEGRRLLNQVEVLREAGSVRSDT